MRLFARKNKGQKLADDDDEEEEEQDFGTIDKRKSPNSAILVVKDENALIRTGNKNEITGGGSVPKRVEAQQRIQDRVATPTLYSSTTGRQLFNNEKQQPIMRSSTSDTRIAAGKNAKKNPGETQELFSMHKLQQQHQIKNNGDNSSSSCYSDASSISIGANNENKSPSFFDASPNDGKEIAGHTSQQSSNIAATPTMIQKSSQHHQITPASAKKQQPIQPLVKQPPSDQERLQFVRNALRRPFGRENIPPSVIEWAVSVDSPKFLKEKRRWEYEVTVTGSGSSNSPNLQDLYHTRRSLRDFCLLELALLQEFSGSLLVPVLELYCIPADEDINERNNRSETDNMIPTSLQDLLSSSEALEPEMLQCWLTDVIHGIRGDGEVILKHASPQQVMLSESMQIFLNQSGPGELIYKNLSLKATAAAIATPNSKNYAYIKHPTATTAPDALLRSMLSCFSIGVESNANCNSHLNSSNDNTISDFFPKCTSRSDFPSDTEERISTESDNLAINSSIAWNEHTGITHFSTRHGRENYSAPNTSDILDAYKVFYESFNSLIPDVQRKINALLQLESALGVAWENFSTSLSNLLSFEKEILECKIGTPLSGEKNKILPKVFKKIEIDDGLKLLAHNKIERGTLGLQALHIMIESLHTDTRSIPRSLNIYLQSYHKMVRGGVVQPPVRQEQYESPDYNTRQSPSVAVESAERMKQFVVQKIDLVKKQLNLNLGSPSFASTFLNEFEEDTCINSSIHANFTKHSPSCNKILADEAMLHEALGKLSQATPIRIARMSWKYFKAEAAQASLVSSAAAELKSKLAHSSIEKHMHDLKGKYDEECHRDDEVEEQLVERILDLSGTEGYLTTHREIALEHHKEQVGRWDAQFTLTILAATGVVDAQVRIEETTRELRFVRNIAIELRKCVDQCAQELEALKRATQGKQTNLSESFQLIKPDSHLNNIFDTRSNFIIAISQMFSMSLVSKLARKTPSNAIFAYAGINISDPSGWLSAVLSNRKASHGGKKGLCGKAAADYFAAKDRETLKFLTQVGQVLRKYEERVERIESSVYMYCVGIQLEKHFSKVRADSLAEWEKKTDIIQAISIATRKRLPQLVKELELNLESFDSKVSHTYVKQAKERHLASKNIKAELQELADRRLDQVKESAMELIIGLIRLWAEYEETNAAVEVTVVEKVIEEIERCVRDQDAESDGGAHLFF